MRKLLLALIAFSASLQLHAQQITLGTYCGDDRSSTREITKAQRALEAKDYPTAQLYIGTALRINENDQHALYLRGELALRNRQIQIAEASWKRLVKDCPGYKPELLFFVGTMALEDGRPEEAKKYLEQWLARNDRNVDYDPETEEMLEEVNLKSTFLANPVPFDPKPARELNTHWDEYLGALTPDGSAMYFTRRSKKRNKYDGPAAPMRSVEEFSVANSEGRRADMPYFDQGEALTAPFNTQYNEGGPTITADNRLMVFTVCAYDKMTRKQNCDLYYTTFEQGVWNGIRPLPEGINLPGSWESQPSISPNGDVLFFASDREGGYGGLDLYRSDLLPNGEWGPVRNLGKTINTKKNEKSPFIHPDSESLYFASDGHPGMGAYDLFKSTEGADGNWGKPQNLGYPINTEQDEIGLMVTLDGSQAYFASNKINRANGWDIYFFDLYESIRPEEVVLVKGSIEKDPWVNESTSVVLKNNKTGEEQRLHLNEDDQSFTTVIKKEEVADILIQVEAKQAAFSAAPIRLQPKTSTDASTVEIKLQHQEMAQGGEYPIPHILFETASDKLDGPSELLIAAFAAFLSSNSNLRVEIQGHTDNVGDATANLDLSKRRARRVALELQNHGIAATRLTHRGFGETRPISSNDTPEGRAQNRRTVFVITSL